MSKHTQRNIGCKVSSKQYAIEAVTSFYSQAGWRRKPAGSMNQLDLPMSQPSLKRAMSELVSGSERELPTPQILNVEYCACSAYACL